MSSPTASATEATRGTSQGGNAEERPGKRIQPAGSYDELGVGYKGKKGGLESIRRAKGTGPRRQTRPAVSMEGAGTQETCSFIELCSAIQH